MIWLNGSISWDGILNWNKITQCIIYFSNLSVGPTTPAPDQEITGQPNTALLSLILTLGTFAIASYLKTFKTSHYLGKTVSIKTNSKFRVWLGNCLELYWSVISECEMWLKNGRISRMAIAYTLTHAVSNRLWLRSGWPWLRSSKPNVHICTHGLMHYYYSRPERLLEISAFPLQFWLWFC